MYPLFRYRKLLLNIDRFFAVSSALYGSYLWLIGEILLFPFDWVIIAIAFASTATGEIIARFGKKIGTTAAFYSTFHGLWHLIMFYYIGYLLVL